MANDRALSIRTNTEIVFKRVRDACERAGRNPEDVIVIAVSKRFPVEEMRMAYEAGIRHFGENRAQELASKVDKWRSSFPDSDVTWHMVGHLQRNKVRDVVGTCRLFHALDSLRLGQALNERAKAQDTPLACLVQVNVSGEASKFGFSPQETADAVAKVRTFSHLDLLGLMTLARPVADPEDVRSEFGKLRGMSERIQSGHAPGFGVLSMGMSGDFEVAIEEGATHIRVGTAIFGDRSTV